MKLKTAAWLLLILARDTHAQEQITTTNAEPQQKVTLSELRFTTQAYQAEASRLLIEEANRVARELGLSEQLPITRSNLTGIYIPPPRMARVVGIGNLSTSNYTY